MKVIIYRKGKGWIWFRILGKGLLVKNVKRSPLTAQQRRKRLKILLFNTYIKPLL